MALLKVAHGFECRESGGMEVNMKSFLEEYGLVVVAAIIIGLFVTFASPFGKSIQSYITSTVQTFAINSQSAVNGAAENTPTPEE